MMGAIHWQRMILNNDVLARQYIPRPLRVPPAAVRGWRTMATQVTRTERSSPAPRTDRYPWVAMGVVLIGTFMVILDSTIVNVALPQIGIDLRQSANIEWVVTAYLLAVGVSQPATGWLADRWGRKTIFTASLGSFATGSLLAALAPNLPVLVAFRVLQGLGGGAMMPIGMAMIYELFPPDRRGTALGIWGIASMAAPAVGPVLGGYLVTAAGWRWLFLINVPIGYVGVVLAAKLLRQTGYREIRPFDTFGFGLSATALLALLLAFSEASDWGWGAPPTLALIALGVILLAVFIHHALHTEHPLVELRMFRIPTFSITIAIVWLLTMMQFGRLVFIPLELETLRGMSALKVGLILTPSAIGAGLTMPLGGRLADKIGSRTPVVVGTAIVGVAAWLLGHLTLTTPVTYLILVLAIQGLGNGLATMPNTVAAMNSVQSRFVAQASAVRSLNRQIAGSLGVAILATVVAGQIGAVSAAGLSGASASEAQHAYNLVFLIALAALAVAFVLAFFLPDRAGARAAQEARASEFGE